MSRVAKCVTWAAGVVLLALLAFAEEAPGGGLKLALKEGSKLWLEGDSTLHAYTINAEVLELDSEVALKPTVDGSLPTLLGGEQATAKITGLTLTVPVEHMKSHIIGLAGQMRKALKYKEHRTIVFVMGSYSVEESAEEPGTYSVVIEGHLTLAGVTNPITLDITAVRREGHIQVTGVEPVFMTDYGVDPPTALFGRIKTDNEITVKWDLLVGLK